MEPEEIGINARNWVDSALDRDYWRVPVNAALNHRVPKYFNIIVHIENVNDFQDLFAVLV